jgi:hypothetical protein
MKYQFKFNLKKINRILRWTGFRIFIGLDNAFMQDTKNNPPKTEIGIYWHGFGFVKELKNDLPLHPES